MTRGHSEQSGRVDLGMVRGVSSFIIWGLGGRWWKPTRGPSGFGRGVRKKEQLKRFGNGDEGTTTKVSFCDGFWCGVKPVVNGF